MRFCITGSEGGEASLQSDERLQPDDFRKLAKSLQQSPIRARKIGFIAARQARRCEVVETHWNGKESVNSARPGDWIATSLSPRQEPLHDQDGEVNTYVIPADGFAELYEPTGGRNEHGAIYRAKGVVDALHFPGGFDIVAPWGERQQAPDGYLILNGNAVYGNNAETFAATYEQVSS